MNIADERPIHGLMNGIVYGQNARVDELNTRIFSRLGCDTTLQPNFDVRPVPTKYARFPVIDRMAMPKVGIRAPMYSTSSTFAPIQSRGPVDGFFENVDHESDLRNQCTALQSAPQAVYVPESNSDLYRVSMAQNVSRREEQPYPRMFDRFDILAKERTIEPGVGSQPFFNNTRVQLRGGQLQS